MQLQPGWTLTLEKLVYKGIDIREAVRQIVTFPSVDMSHRQWFGALYPPKYPPVNVRYFVTIHPEFAVRNEVESLHKAYKELAELDGKTVSYFENELRSNSETAENSDTTSAWFWASHAEQAMMQEALTAFVEANDKDVVNHDSPTLQAIHKFLADGASADVDLCEGEGLTAEDIYDVHVGGRVRVLNAGIQSVQLGWSRAVRTHCQTMKTISRLGS